MRILTIAVLAAIPMWNAGGDAETAPQPVRKDLYAHMSDSFVGRPARAELETLTRKALARHGEKADRATVYRFGSIVFTLARRTGLAEIDIMRCMARAEPAATMDETAGRCVGISGYSLARTI